MQASALRKGTTILFRGELYTIIDFSHHTPGNLRAFVRVSIKNLKNGKIIQHRFSATEDVERVIMESKQCQYLYHDDHGYHFMDMQSYETITLSEDMVGDGKYYLLENMEIKVDFHEGTPVSPEFPKQVILKVTESPPWVKGDSVSNNMKPAVCETGLKVQVPIFVEEGTDIKINTETGEYLGRA